MSSSTGLTDLHRGFCGYGAILIEDAKAAALTVPRSTRFECIIDLHVAIAIGLEAPATPMARPDEAIE